MDGRVDMYARRNRVDRRKRTVVRALVAALATAAVGLSPSVATADFQPPPVRHVWVINLENASYGQTFGDGGNFFGADTPPHPYLKNVLPSRGALLRQFYAIGHNSLDNYIAQVSGQAPNPDSQGDCLTGGDTEFVSAGTDPHGQEIGQGCIYPPNVKTLADQLDARGMTWRGYMEDLGNVPRGPGLGDEHSCDRPNGYVNQNVDLYAAKHNPYVWFHSLIDQPGCEKHNVPLTSLGRDLASIATTPNLSFVTPSGCNDGHDCDLDTVDEWLQRWIPVILASPAYRQDGMVIVTFDEASSLVGVSAGDDTSACCNEIPGPNSPMPGVSGPGGGRVGAVILSPYVKPGTVSDSPYNHYSLLRSLEDAFGITTGGDDGHGHLGFAGSYDPTYPGPGSFGCDVYDVYGPCQAPAKPATPAAAPLKSGGSKGPRPADGSARWQNPVSTSNDLASISCPSTSTCFAVGDAGTIVATTNSGATWAPQPTGTAADLTGIACPSSSACVAVGNGGTILRTGDGGATWSKPSSGTVRQLNAVTCPTGDRCYAAGTAGTILTSADGGGSWNAQSSGTDSTLFAISCPDADTCYAGGDVYLPHEGPIGPTWWDAVLKTSDGGGTWVIHDTNQPANRVRAIACSDPSRCYLAGADFGSKTTDGGATWNSPGGGYNDGARYFGITCASTTNCVAVGVRSASFNVTGFPPVGQITSMSDGSSFTRQASGTPDVLRSVSCPTAAACYAVGDRGTILARSDGVHWSEQSRNAVPIPASMGSLRTPPTRTPQLLGASCPSTSTCFAVGDGGSISATTNGGGHWSSQSSPTNDRLYAVGCAKASTGCVAAGDRGTIAGTSTGTSWSEQSSGTSQALTGVSCPVAGSCVVVGDQGTILTTTDGGATWHSRPSGTDADLNAVSCASASLCTAVGSLGTILKTTNGGDSWTTPASGTTAYLGGVSCPRRTNDCYAAGQAGTLLATTDGSKTWAAKPTGVSDQLNSISCVSATSCVATGSTGTVLSTASGGTSWTVQGTGTTRNLTAASCASTTACIAAGDTGTILGITPRATP
jgi:phosphatidylinositol-3-phosphatase